MVSYWTAPGIRFNQPLVLGWQREAQLGARSAFSSKTKLSGLAALASRTTQENHMAAFEGWENFYVIVGPSAGALIGLQFVVATLLADAPITRIDSQASDAFTTPSVVHFGAVLLLSAIVSAPWRGIVPVASLWGLLGLCGMIYCVIVVRRMRAQTAYQPVFEDRLFHVLLPLAAYGGLTASAAAACFYERPAFFLLAAAVLLLLFTGIHNAWDAVLYHVFVTRQKKRKAETPPATNK